MASIHPDRRGPFTAAATIEAITNDSKSIFEFASKHAILLLQVARGQAQVEWEESVEDSGVSALDRDSRKRKLDDTTSLHDQCAQGRDQMMRVIRRVKRLCQELKGPSPLREAMAKEEAISLYSELDSLAAHMEELSSKSKLLLEN